MTKKPQQPENQPNSDERNIVSLDSSYEGASLEDRLYLFWHQYHKIIIGLCLVVAVVLAGWGISHVLQERREAQVAAAFQDATTIEEKREFAQRFSPHPAAGTAFLEVADHFFGEGNYEEASAYYTRAAEDLGELPTAGRARIGRGVALALAERPDEALTVLEAVARDPRNYEIIRAEAYYHAATLAIDLGRYSTARQHIEQVFEFDRSQMWSQRAMGLSRVLPEEEEPEEAGTPEA